MITSSWEEMRKIDKKFGGISGTSSPKTKTHTTDMWIGRGDPECSLWNFITFCGILLRCWIGDSRPDKKGRNSLWILLWFWILCRNDSSDILLFFHPFSPFIISAKLFCHLLSGNADSPQKEIQDTPPLSQPTWDRKSDDL